MWDWFRKILIFRLSYAQRLTSSRSFKLQYFIEWGCKSQTPWNETPQIKDCWILFWATKCSQHLFFEKPSFSMFCNRYNSILIQGRSTALVCDSGETYTRVTPVHDGFCLYKSSKSIPYGGSTVTQSVRKIV